MIDSPLRCNILERVGTRERKRNKDDMCLTVSQWSQTLIIFLACCIPERQLYGFSVHATVCNIILENGGYVSL